jgi:hypothetical protein
LVRKQAAERIPQALPTHSRAGRNARMHAATSQTGEWGKLSLNHVYARKQKQRRDNHGGSKVRQESRGKRRETASLKARWPNETPSCSQYMPEHAATACTAGPPGPRVRPAGSGGHARPP